MSFFSKIFGAGAPSLSEENFRPVSSSDPEFSMRQLSVTGRPNPKAPGTMIRYYVVLDHNEVPPPELHASILRPLIHQVGSYRCILMYDVVGRDQYKREIDAWLSPRTPHAMIQTISYANPDNLYATLYLFTVRPDIQFTHIYFCSPTSMYVGLRPPTGGPEDVAGYRQAIAPAPTRGQLENLIGSNAASMIRNSF